MPAFSIRVSSSADFFPAIKKVFLHLFPAFMSDKLSPTMKDWLKLMFSGFEFEEVPSDEILKQAEEVLDEQQ